MKKNLGEQIKTLATNGNQNHHERYFAFAAGLANKLDQHMAFSNEFIRNLALTSDQDLLDLLQEHPEAFPYLLLLRVNEKENYTTLSNFMQDYVENLAIYINNPDDLDQKWKNYFDSDYTTEFSAENDLNTHKQWIEYFKNTTIAKLVYDKFQTLEKQLYRKTRLADNDENLLDSLYKQTLETEAALMKNFNETAAIQLPALGLNQTISLLKEVNSICVIQYINRTYSNEFSAAGNIKDSLKRVNQEEIQDLIKTKKVEEAKRLQQEQESNDKAKIASAIQTLEAVKNDLTNSTNLQELITKVNEIFEDNIKDETFKRLKDNLKLIAEKQDLGAFMKFIDNAIECFKSFVGKDRMTETIKNTALFTEKIQSKQIPSDKIKRIPSSSGISS